MPLLPVTDRKPSFLLGVNYWSRAGGPRMWERFDAARVAAELTQMRSIGLDCCRCFAFIPSVMPRGGELASGPLRHMRELFDRCASAGLAAIPTFLVGHMSGRNFDFDGQDGRCLYSDPELLDRQRRLVHAVAGVGAGHPAVAAYLASNEMPLWGGPAPRELIVAWARSLREALDAVDPHRPFGLGDGVMNLEGGQNGFDVCQLAESGIVDLVGPHSYYVDDDDMRQALNAEYCVRSLSHLGLPVLFEEFGGSTMQVCEEYQPHYYRELLHGCVSAGAAGAIAWCFSDFELSDELPYSHQTFELGFGITRADGSEKPVCDELRAFARLLTAVEPETLTPPRPLAAIVVPDFFNTAYPFSREDRRRMRRTLLQGYVLCVKAGIEAELVPETADLARYRLLLLPATQKLLAPTWERLLAHARAGATVYWSYFAGDHPFLQGAWCHTFTELTGCAHRMRYGCLDLPPPRLQLVGDDLSLEVETGGNSVARSFLPTRPLAAAGTEVIARDGAGGVALTRVAHGAGSCFFCAFPLEYYLARQAAINARDRSEQLYRLLAADAAVQQPVSCDQPAVQIRLVESRGGRLLWLLNHGWHPVCATVDAPGGAPLCGSERPLRDGANDVELGPKQVAVFRVADQS